MDEIGKNSHIILMVYALRKQREIAEVTSVIYVTRKI